MPSARLPAPRQVDPILLIRRSKAMQHGTSELAQAGRTPVVPLLLGWAGVAPFAALAFSAILDPPAYVDAAMSAIVGFGAIIMSFMGGVLWGLEMSQPRSQATYAVSIVPTLVAFAALVLQAKYGILLLLCGFAGLLAVDLRYSRSGGTPSWYPILRWQLTAAVIALLSVTLLFSR